MQDIRSSKELSAAFLFVNGNTVHLSSSQCSSIISEDIFKQMCLHHYKKRRFKWGKGGKEQSNLGSGSLQLSRQLEEPTNCSWVKAHSLAEPIPDWTITFTGEARADKIVYTNQNCHKYYSKPYENVWWWQVVRKQAVGSAQVHLAHKTISDFCNGNYWYASNIPNF